MRLDWFLPFFRKRFDGQTRQLSVARRILRRLGPSVVSSPTRRLVQAICFLVFLVLFYYVCWPYTAQPGPPGRESSGWELARIDQDAGTFHFSHAQAPDWVLQTGHGIHVIDQGVDSTVSIGYAGAFELVNSSDEAIELRPAIDLTDEQFDRLLTSLGPFFIK